MSNSEHVPALADLSQLRARIGELESREQEQREVEANLEEWRISATLTRDISLALIQSSTLPESLQQCAQAFVIHLGAAFARIWTLNTNTNILELHASAGMYTHLDGSHSRVPVGTLKIGLIASKRLPLLTNSVIGDPHISHQEWAQREGMVAFAGYPLLIEGELVGVIALFARQPLSSAVLDTMASVSNIIALGIQRKRGEEERSQLLLIEQQATAQAEADRARLVRILDNLPDGFMIFDDEWRYTYINPQATPYTGKPWRELLGKNVWEEFPELKGSSFYQQYHRAVTHQEDVAFEVFSSVLSRWFDIHAYPIPGGLVVYFRDITARKQAEEERVQLLEEAEIERGKAESALQVRNDFLSNVTHDLKTPLAAIRGNVQLLQRQLKRGKTIEPEWLANRLAAVETSTVKMSGMVEDLLDVAKLQAGQKLDLDICPIQLVPFVFQLCAEQQEGTQQHKILVVTSTEDIIVQGDPVRLERVLSNLLTNAMKYSPRGGQITVEITHAEEQNQLWVAITIRDQGMGIPAADLPHIFEPFYRASNVTGNIQGTGVGLASVTQVIAHHGGTISVASEEGNGCSFTVRLPCASKQA